MNDYPFGNQLYALRTTAGLSQQEVADAVGVSNKAVSKWENGRTKPSTNALRKLSALFHVPIETMLSLREQAMRPEITKIVITGGPCAGKTTINTYRNS